MYEVQRSKERGRVSIGWLESMHSFSFGSYYNPERMGYRALRVINEDWIRGGGGFGMHPHRDMEIITVMLEGALEHKDSLGNGAVIRPGEIQRMSAGRGVRHSEFNASKTETAHLLQIWIEPRDSDRGIPPEYEESAIPDEHSEASLTLLVSGDGRGRSLKIHQDADLFFGQARSDVPLRYNLAAGRHLWVQVIEGRVTIQGHELHPGDALYGSGEALAITTPDRGRFLLFDLP